MKFKNIPGVALDVTYDGGYLARLNLYMTPLTVAEARVEPPISSSMYDRLLIETKQLGSFGDFINTGGLAVGGRSWQNYITTDDFTCVSVSRATGRCTTTEENCPIAGFDVTYWIPFNGTVEGKRVAVIVDGQSQNSKFLVKVDGTEAEVCDWDYGQLSVGQVIRAQRSLCCCPRILETRN
jgi:hypothetical protein